MSARRAPVAVRLARFALRRDLAASEVRLMLVALAIAVAASTAVAVTAGRLQAAAARDAGALLGADLVVEAPSPLPAALARRAGELGLATVTLTSTRSMARAGERFQLCELRAAGPGYPLRGELLLSAGRHDAAHPAQAPPPRGRAWVTPRLLDALGIEPGQAFELGELRLVADRVIRLEPGRAGELFSIAPTVILNPEDLDAAGLIGPASRASWKLLVAGPAASVRSYAQWVRNRYGAELRTRGIEDVRPELRRVLDRVRQYGTLAALITVLVAGVAVALVAQRLAARQLVAAAVLRSFGATRRQLLGQLLLEVLALGVAGGLAGVLLGLGAHLGLVRLAAELVGGGLPPPSFAALATGPLTGVVVLAGFVLPVLLPLTRTPPARVLGELAAPPRPAVLAWGAAALLAVAALAPWHSGDLRVTALATAGLAGGTAAAALVLWLAAGLARVVRRRGPPALTLALTNLVRFRPLAVAQASALALGAAALLSLAVLRGGLLEHWLRALPADTPNYFLVNIQPDERDAVRAFLSAELGREAPALSPMVRARLTHINDRAVLPERYADPADRRMALRTFNLSWRRELPPDNRLVAGRWWSRPDAAEASLDAHFAGHLGVGIGDRLRFVSAGQAVELTVTSLRRVAWDSFNVNFFVLTAPGALSGLPATWVTSLHLDPGEEAVLTRLVERFPSVTVVDVAALVAQLERVLSTLAGALQVLFLLTLAAGATALVAAVLASERQRLRDAAVWRALGVTSRTLRRSAALEFALLGGIAGLIGGVVASGLAWVLGREVFDLPAAAPLWPLAAGAGAVALATALLATAALRRASRVPPRLALSAP